MPTVTLINLQLIGAKIVGRTGALYTVAADGSIAVQPSEALDMLGLGFQLNAANPFKLPWSAKSANFTCDAGSHGYLLACVDPATMAIQLPNAANSDGAAYFFATGVSDGVITLFPFGTNTIDGDAERIVSSNALYICDGTDWHHF